MKTGGVMVVDSPVKILPLEKYQSVREIIAKQVQSGR
jgi:hypothetical protein